LKFFFHTVLNANELEPDETIFVHRGGNVGEARPLETDWHCVLLFNPWSAPCITVSGPYEFYRVLLWNRSAVTCMSGTFHKRWHVTSL